MAKFFAILRYAFAKRSIWNRKAGKHDLNSREYCYQMGHDTTIFTLEKQCFLSQGIVDQRNIKLKITPQYTCR